MKKMTKKLKDKEISYNKPGKNRMRELIIDFINKNDINSILTLESSEFIFSKGIPNKKVIVFENNNETHKRMDKRKPKNVSLFLGDISTFASLDSNIDCIYLDFTSTYQSNQETIYELRKQIKDCKLFIITLFKTFRGKNKPVMNGDYEFDIINKLQTLTNVNWKILYGEKYNNNMITIIMENPNKE